jgi:hypothetical protein
MKTQTLTKMRMLTTTRFPANQVRIQSVRVLVLLVLVLLPR